jgi:hypothetical protein
MLQPMSEKEKELTIKACVNACKNINTLNKRSYQFIMLSSGFIAHYNINGFKAVFNAPEELKNAVIRYAPQNTWTNFRLGEQDYEYYHQKGEIYQEIVKRLKELPCVLQYSI